jgi:hypothetical protein
MHQERPLFSTITSNRFAEFAAVALVNESPKAAITSISPGRSFENQSWYIILNSISFLAT